MGPLAWMLAQHNSCPFKKGMFDTTRSTQKEDVTWRHTKIKDKGLEESLLALRRKPAHRQVLAWISPRLLISGTWTEPFTLLHFVWHAGQQANVSSLNKSNKIAFARDLNKLKGKTNSVWKKERKVVSSGSHLYEVSYFDKNLLIKNFLRWSPGMIMFTINKYH